jgi:hypothetical protein
VFAARPPAGPAPRPDLHLAGAARRAFAGSTDFLADAENRARIAEYLADMTRPYAIEVAAELTGHSYGEMAEPLIAELVCPDEPVDLLVLSFSGHDLRPGRPTAAHLSHVTPGSPLAFAVCDQGSAAPFSGLRIAREYACTAGVRRALLIAVEQAVIPYQCQARLPSEHRAVAMLFTDSGPSRARVTDVCQHPDVPPEQVAGLAAAEAVRLSTGDHKVTLVLSDSLAEVWSVPPRGRVRVMPASQPFTGVWWGVIDELNASTGDRILLIAADYDPGLRYLCLTVFEKEPAKWETP